MQFTVYVNNHKARTGHEVEVAIYGEPGAYVGLAGTDKAFYTMQAANQISLSRVCAHSLTSVARSDRLAVTVSPPHVTV